MDWPQINIVAFSLLVAALCILVPRYVRRRSEEAQALVYDLLPRLILLQEIYDTQPSLPFLYEGEEWRHFYEKMKRVLGNIQVAAGEKQQGNQILTTKRVSTAIDGHLLRYLQSQPKLAELVQEYLPAPGQSWATFLRGKEEQYSDLESDSTLFQVPEEKQVEALECVRVLVDSFLDDLEQIDSSISDATRGDTGSTSKRGISKIQVYYATDRAVTADGDYTKNRSKRNGLHYGYMVVGIPGGDRKLGQKADPGKNEEADPLKHIVFFTVVTQLPECKDRDDKEGFVENLEKALQSESSVWPYLLQFKPLFELRIHPPLRLFS